MLYLHKPLEVTENLVGAIQRHYHCTWWQQQDWQKEKDDHHYQHLSGRIEHNNLDRMVAGPRDIKATINHQQLHLKPKIE